MKFTAAADQLLPSPSPIATISASPSPSATSSPSASPSSSATPHVGPYPIPPTPAPNEQPPPGITPTDKTLAQVLQLLRSSYGKAKQPVKTSREVDAITAYGENGTATEIWSGDDYVDTFALGPTVFMNGRYHGQKWSCNENGYTRLITGAHQEDQVSSLTLVQSITGSASDYVKLLGEVPKPTAYVVDVHPPGGRHEWLFIEKSTGRLVRKEAAELDARVAWTFDDFRTTNGITEPWHEHFNANYPDNNVDWTTTAIDYNSPIPAREFAIRPSRWPVEFPEGVQSVRLPARIEYGDIIVRLYIEGRGLDFQLDSGSDSIVIDNQVAAQLGLKTFGENTQTVAGKFQASNAIVPEMRVGDLTMHNLVVQTMPFNVDEDWSTKVVGLLGYDFLAGMVAKVDYVNGTVDAYNPASFSAPPGQSFELQMALDDSVPMVGARLGDDVGNHFIVDTGASDIIVFNEFTKAHPNALKFFTIKVGNKTFEPLQFSAGVGGWLLIRPATVDNFHFGGVGFQNFIVFGMYGAEAAFQGEDTDGLIGETFLQWFDLYFDYKDATLILVPNKHLTDNAKKPS